MADKPSAKHKDNRRLGINLLAMTAGMLMLSFASVPMYKLFCAATGIGGTTQQSKAAPGAVGDRTIAVRFNADIDPGLPWKFQPSQKETHVKIGERALAFYTAENLGNAPVKGQATYNVTPHKAGAYFDKIQCFCFEEQTLGRRQKVEMPVSFFIDPAILSDPQMNDIDTITLSYTFFPVKK